MTMTTAVSPLPRAPASRAHRERAGAEPGALWMNFHDELRRFVARWVAAPDVDDILQTIYLRIHNALTRPIEIAHPRGWMFQVARSALADHLRSAKARRAHTAALPDAVAIAAPEPDDDQVDRELTRCVMPLLDALPEPYRTALVWTEVDGMTQHEAASRAGISLSGMKSRVQRGRDRLKDALLDCCEVNLDRRRRPIDSRPRGACQCGSGRNGAANTAGENR